jgi:carbamoyltransferase
MKTKCILSFTLSGHGFSGAVCIDGDIKYATSLERITRIKNDILFPISKSDLKSFGWNDDPQRYVENIDLEFDLERDYSNIDLRAVEKFNLLLNYLLDAAKITFDDIDCVVYSYRHNKIVENFFKEKNPNIVFIVPEHHFSHSCQAFLPSEFNQAAIMVVDGQGVPMDRTNGDQLCGSLSFGNGIEIETLVEFPVKYSLGGMYAAFTSKLGFKTNQEGKTMGLAAYGTPELYNILRKELKFNSIDFDFKGIFKKGMKFHNALYILPNYNKFLKKFPKRKKDEPFTQTHKDLAYAVQKITEDVMIYLGNWLFEKTGSKNLCIAGGVGLNCVANYQVLINTKFDNIFIHPNAGDNGLVVGQALYVYNVLGRNPRNYVDTHDYLGKQYTNQEISEAIDGYKYIKDLEIIEYSEMEELYNVMADAIAKGYITSWFQGRSEFGPRALGNRSILADPRRSNMKDILNSRVKFRESFRPFTPSVLVERSNEFFELEIESPFMLLAPYVKKGKAEIVPAITHADNTARVQTVSKEVNERYYGLISAFERKTGVPMILDTSFNVADEPIVETPHDAIRCFLSTDIDLLGIGNFILKKKSKF